MAIEFIANRSAGAVDGGDVTLTLSTIAGLAQNDLVIVSFAIGTNDGVDLDMTMVTAGYTEVADLFHNDTQDCNLGVFYKFMPSTPDASAVVDGQGGVDAAVAAVCKVFRGVDTTTPMDVAATTASVPDTMHPNPPSIDWTTAGVCVVIAGASAHVVGAGGYTFPFGYTDGSTSRFSDDTTGCSVGMGHKLAPADPEDPGVMTHAGTDNAGYSNAAVTMALRPAGVAVALVIPIFVGA